MSEFGRSKEAEIAEVKQYWYKAVKMASEGKYEDVIQHLKPGPKSQEMLKILGATISSGRQRLISSADYSVSDANFIAMSSMYHRESKHIQVGGVPKDAVQYHHDAALVYLEEWGHLFQDVSGKQFDVSNPDHEVDIADYLIRNGVKVTPAFMDRYDRHEQLIAMKKIDPSKLNDIYVEKMSRVDDSREPVPSLRRGMFVQLPDQKFSEHWQVSGFDGMTGEVLLFEGISNQLRRISRNQIQPEWLGANDLFKGCDSWIDIERKVGELGVVIGSNGMRYDRAAIAAIIEQTRGSGKELDKFPRSGGLRLRMAELYKQVLGVQSTSDLVIHAKTRQLD